MYDAPLHTINVNLTQIVPNICKSRINVGQRHGDSRSDDANG